MESIELINIVLIISGGLIIALSAWYTFQLLKKIKTNKYLNRWKFLLGMMLLFSLGYFTTALIVILQDSSVLHPIAAVIFFLGALFVYLTSWTGINTIEDLLATTVSKDYVENIIKSMADTLIVINADQDASIRTVNRATINLLGYDTDELVGKSINQIIDLEILDKLKTDVLTGSNTSLSIETTYKTKSGEAIPVSLSATTLQTPKGNVEGVIYVAQDIRERKEAERKIKEYVTQLKQLNASKDRFFSIIAHDLRNPFTGVLGAADILANDAPTMDKKEIGEFAQALYKQSKSIYDLLENLLEWSRIQTGRIEYTPVVCNTSKCINKALNIYDGLSAKKKINLLYTNGENLEVFADENMMFTVLRNLISNAIKFTPEGGTVSINTKDLQNNFVEVSVKDTGVGIPIEMQNKLFKIDEHVSTKGTNEEEGTGLGLILCKELVEKNGGKIKVESKPKEGTTFTFTLPKGNDG